MIPFHRWSRQNSRLQQLDDEKNHPYRLLPAKCPYEEPYSRCGNADKARHRLGWLIMPRTSGMCTRVCIEVFQESIGWLNSRSLQGEPWIMHGLR